MLILTTMRGSMTVWLVVLGITGALMAPSFSVAVTTSSVTETIGGEVPRILSTTGYCGYPDVPNPWFQSLQVCGGSHATEEDCSEEYYDAVTYCRWHAGGNCTSDALEAGDLDPLCPSATTQTDCEVLYFFGTRRCAWFELPIPSPYCGYPDVANPWEYPIEICGESAMTAEHCSEEYYDTVTHCHWDTRGYCSSDALEAGDLDPLCPSATSESDCEELHFFGTRRCVWLAPPTSAPSLVPSVSSLPSSGPTVSFSNIPSSAPTLSVSPTAVPTASVLPTLTPSSSWIPSATPTGSTSPSTLPTSSVPPSAVVTTSLAPSALPSLLPSSVPTLVPTSSVQPTAGPSDRESAMPSMAPVRQSSSAPSATPTKSPSAFPTRRATTPLPSRSPTPEPTRRPTERPTPIPSRRPTSPPSRHPTPLPSRPPTPLPSRSPTAGPTPSPTHQPTPWPSQSPSGTPSVSSTSGPSQLPTPRPSTFSTFQPSFTPTGELSKAPSVSPPNIPSPLPSVLPTTTSIDTAVNACICDTQHLCLVNDFVEKGSTVSICLDLSSRAVRLVEIKDMMVSQMPHGKAIVEKAQVAVGAKVISLDSHSVLVEFELPGQFDSSRLVEAAGHVAIGRLSPSGRRRLKDAVALGYFHLLFMVVEGNANGVVGTGSPDTDIPGGEDNNTTAPGNDAANGKSRMMKYTWVVAVVLVGTFGIVIVVLLLEHGRREAQDADDAAEDPEEIGEDLAFVSNQESCSTA